MTERWGSCRHCKGSGTIKSFKFSPKLITQIECIKQCPHCLGEGYDGTIETYLDKNYGKEWADINMPKDEEF
ncbi:hypothetical protein GOV11_04305 [Candidatus Woesearchaeota archaeon]|nr:hypothetical protein [Candidatus Woesearchaeota archaeon]